MKLEKTIRVMEGNRDFFKADGFLECAEACQISIEALKARKIWQDEEGFDPVEALLGETE